MLVTGEATTRKTCEYSQGIDSLIKIEVRTDSQDAEQLRSLNSELLESGARVRARLWGGDTDLDVCTLSMCVRDGISEPAESTLLL